MSVRPHKIKAKRHLVETSWRFWLDKQGRLRRVCRCDYCCKSYRRPSPGEEAR